MTRLYRDSLVVFLLAVISGCASEALMDKQWPMGPGPGDVYREYTYARRFGEVDPEAPNPAAEESKQKAGLPRRVVIKDLYGATAA